MAMGIYEAASIILIASFHDCALSQLIYNRRPGSDQHVIN